MPGEGEGAGPPTLRTSRLLLRPFVPDDAPRVRELAGDPDVALMTATVPHPYEEGMAEAWIASHTAQIERGVHFPFAVLAAEEGLVGAAGLDVDREEGRAELGYWIGKPYWGLGYATEASRALLDFGFGELGLRRVFAHHLPENPASGRVMEKIGMVREGVLRRHRIHRGERPVDLVLYGILAEEW